tara:strand:+ start:468 stop:734 length:267 start_codon:yes stop_codon:yes gene_type:complete
MANPGLLLKAARMLSKTPAGKKAKKKILNAVRPKNFTDQFSISNSTVRDRLTQGMKIASNKMTTVTEATKAAAAAGGAGYLLGKKKKK